MPFSLVLLPASVITLLAVIALVTRRAIAPSCPNSREFDMERYRPLGKLLSSEDFQFVTGQGLPFGRAIGYRFRRFRVTVAYLAALSADFRRVHRTGRLLIVCSDKDLPALNAALMRAQLVFWGASALAYGEAILMLLGFSFGLGNAQTALGSLSELARAVAAVRLPEATLSHA